jgi:hypothetical protein
MRGTFLLAATLLLSSLAVAPTTAQPPQSTAGARVDGLKVLSSRVDDVTTVENILRSFVRPGMSDQERAQALWTAAVKYRHQAPPPNEYLAEDWEAHDPVKLFNTYGYCMCCCASAVIEALNRADGRAARGRVLTGHSVPEVRYDDGWHMFDASLLTFFPRADGSVASVDEIAASVRDWYEKHPEYRGKPQKLFELMRSGGWTGWKQEGPALLADCPFYSRGYLPARTHGWDATMQEYDRQSEVYEYGYQTGHRALFTLRPGEEFVREAGNRGLDVNGDRSWDGLRARAPEGDLGYLKQFFPGYNGGIVANGSHRYAPDLAAGGLAAGAEVYDNLTAGGSPPLRPKAAGRPGVAVVELASPYVYLDGKLRARGVRPAAADRVAFSVSTNGGRTFAPLWTANQVGPWTATVDLKPRVARRYAYWLKVELTGGGGLEALTVENDFQHAPRTLPWLGKGDTTITVAADGDPRMASRAFTGRITPAAEFQNNESTRSLGVTFDNLEVRDGSCWWRGGTGSMTLPIQTPGDLVGLRFGGHVRARDAKDRVRMLVSFDGGQSWKEAASIVGPTPATTGFFEFRDVPPGTRRALLRYELSGNNTIGLFSFRADADYRDPLGARAFRPFSVIHRWKESGRDRQAERRVDRLPFTYTLHADAEPEMVSVSYRMPTR